MARFPVITTFNISKNKSIVFVDFGGDDQSGWECTKKGKSWSCTQIPLKAKPSKAIRQALVAAGARLS